MSFALPDRLGPYEVRAKLAEGGMASIYLGHRVSGSGPSHVALKVIKEEFARNAEFVDMFVDEARIIAKLDHPNVVKLYDAGREGERLYFAMELLMGQSLWHVWEACRERSIRLRYDMAAWIGARVAEGLHHAHEVKDGKGVPQELVHRDVNQTNIFLTYDGQVKIIDFGLAKALGRISRTGAGVVKGKLAYMSPEQTIGKPVDRRTDVFALGTTLWELTCDRRLFRGKDDAETLKAVHEAVVPPAVEIVAGYPTWLWEVIRRALARDPNQRYQTAGELARALDACSLRGGRRISASSLSEVMGVLFERERLRQAAWFEQASAKPGDEVPDSVDSMRMPTLRPMAVGGNVSYVAMGSESPSASDLFAPAVDERAFEPPARAPAEPTVPAARSNAPLPPPRPPGADPGAEASLVGVPARRRPHPILLLIMLSLLLAGVGAGLAIVLSR